VQDEQQGPATEDHARELTDRSLGRREDEDREQDEDDHDAERISARDHLAGEIPARAFDRAVGRHRGRW